MACYHSDYWNFLMTDCHQLPECTDIHLGGYWLWEHQPHLTSALAIFLSLWQPYRQSIPLLLPLVPSALTTFIHPQPPTFRALPSVDMSIFRPPPPLKLWTPISSFWPASLVPLTINFLHFQLPLHPCSSHRLLLLLALLLFPPSQSPYHSSSVPAPDNQHSSLATQTKGLTPTCLFFGKKMKGYYNLGCPCLGRLTKLFWSIQPASTSFPLGFIFFWRHTPALLLRFWLTASHCNRLLELRTACFFPAFPWIFLFLFFPFGPFSQVQDLFSWGFLTLSLLNRHYTLWDVHHMFICVYTTHIQKGLGILCHLKYLDDQISKK